MGQNQTKPVSSEEEIAAKVLEDDEPDDWYRFRCRGSGVSGINLGAGTNGSLALDARVGSASAYSEITDWGFLYRRTDQHERLLL